VNGFAPTTEDSRGQVLREVRPDDFSHYSYGVRPDSFHTNYANCPAHAESNESFYQARSTGARRKADGRSTVRWDELPVPVPVPSQGDLIRMPLDQTPDLFTPDESAYHTARRTSSCPTEPPTSNSSTRANKGQMSVERWRSTHLPNLKGKNRCYDAVRVPRIAGKMQKRARLDVRQGVRPRPVIGNADPLPVGAESEAHRGAHREADSRGRPESMCRIPRLPVRPIRVLLKERRLCPSRSIC